MDYQKTAREILNLVGGSKNIVSAAHCATRLRLVIADNSKADKEALENVEGVKGVFEASGQLQIILGTGTVNKVFDQFIAIAGITASSKAEAKEAAAQKQNIFMRAIKLLGDMFVPDYPGDRGERFPDGNYELARFHDQQRIYFHGYQQFDLCIRQSVQQHGIYIPADPDRLFRGKGIRGQPVSGRGYRYDYD